jgi:hypothetical protein
MRFLFQCVCEFVRGLYSALVIVLGWVTSYTTSYLLPRNFFNSKEIQYEMQKASTPKYRQYSNWLWDWMTKGLQFESR